MSRLTPQGTPPDPPRLNTTACPVGCGRRVRHRQLLCPPCWRQVPGEIQRRVYRTWRAYAAVPNDENWEPYKAARDDAIASIP